MKLQENFTITSYTVAHMIAQIRAKQLATKDIQDCLQKEIKRVLEENWVDTSGEDIVKKIQTEMRSQLFWVNYVNNKKCRCRFYRVSYKE
jgi:hypothetical protein